MELKCKTTLNKNEQIFFCNRLHLYGTYEQGEEEEGEVRFKTRIYFSFLRFVLICSQVYEVLNIRSLKQATPNLRVINLWGVRCFEIP